MKVILSRKGFDSKNGGMPSPIMPDGTLLSLPIPVKKEINEYSKLYYDGKSLLSIIKELNPRKAVSLKTCHLDPDIRRQIKPRKADWQAAFGQVGAAQGHLKNEKITEGDLFLFWGMFRETEKNEGVLRFKRSAQILHVIFGYLEIKKILTEPADIVEFLKDHPHSSGRLLKATNNTIYTATKKLSLNNYFTGAGCLKYHKELVLTKKGLSKSRWELPAFFKRLKISYHDKNSFENNYFQSASIGQEFVVEENTLVEKWAKNIITIGMT